MPRDEATQSNYGGVPGKVSSSAFPVRSAQALLVAAALALLLISAFGSPEMLAGSFSPDGEIAAGSNIAIQVGRAVCAVMAIAMLVIATRPGWIDAVMADAILGNAGLLPSIVCGLLVVAALLGIGFLISALTGTHIGHLLRDPNAIAGLPFYYGALEYAGIMLMSMAGGIAIFSGTLLGGRPRRLLVSGGLLTLLLVCDDLYMIHENSAYFYLNEKVTFAIYAFLALLFAGVNFRQLLITPFILLGIAAIFFASALLFDSISGLSRIVPRGGEEMVELCGICFWSIYFIKYSRDALHIALSHRGAGQLTASNSMSGAT
jgi:hypothetical protein